MARVKSCCCGCTLRTGSLIILWLTVVYDAIQILKYLGNTNKLGGAIDSSMIGLRTLEFATAVIALYGIYEKRPSFLLPFISLSVFFIVILVTLLFLLIVASSLVIRSGIFDQVINSMYQKESIHSVDYGGSNDYSSSNPHDDVEIAKAVTTAVVMGIAIGITIVLALSSYFTVVVYSLYKQMVEGTDNTGGVIYSAPVDQGAMGGGGGYPQPQLVYPHPQSQPIYPHPQSQPVYPPSYGQQPGGVYPPLSEMKQ